MPAAQGGVRELTTTLDGGEARVHVVATNDDAGDTVRVRLEFGYEIEEGWIALDEIIQRIAIRTRNAEMGTFGKVAIVPNEVHLNPNRVPLVYEATLYRPPGSYRVRLRVFGNYE